MLNNKNLNNKIRQGNDFSAYANKLLDKLSNSSGKYMELVNTSINQDMVIYLYIRNNSLL